MWRNCKLKARERGARTFHFDYSHDNRWLLQARCHYCFGESLEEYDDSLQKCFLFLKKGSLVVFKTPMIWISILALLLGWLLWYGIAYARFGDASVVDELRDEYKRLAEEFEQQGFSVNEFREQNLILKEKALRLRRENEDYAKIVSQLNRYYYHLNEASEKVKELVEILHVDETDLHRTLLRFDGDKQWEAVAEIEEDDQPKQFF